MNILLLNPPRVKGIPLVREDFCSREAEKGTVYPPLSIAYTASVLENCGHKVVVLDANGEGIDWASTIYRIGKSHPDIIGFWSTNFSLRQDAYFLGKIQQDILVVVTEPIISTTWPKDFLELFPRINVAILGESDIIYPYLVSTIEKGGDLENVKGIAFRSRDRNVKVSPPQIITKDLDRIPIPAYHLLPMHAYRGFLRLPFSNFLASRGCPWSCKFCIRSSIPELEMYKPHLLYRTRSVESVIEELEILVHKYGRKEVIFEDSTFNFNLSRVGQICDGLTRSKLELKWCANVRVDNLNRELLEKLKRAGCWCLRLGMEFASERVLNASSKKIVLEQTLNALKLCKKTGIKIHAFCMWGYPGESVNDVLDTAKLVSRYSTYSFSFSSVVPLPGTPFFSECVQNNLILDWDKYLNKAEWAVEALSARKWMDKPVLTTFDENTHLRLRTEIQKTTKLRMGYILPRLFRIRSLTQLRDVINAYLRLKRTPNLY